MEVGLATARETLLTEVLALIQADPKANDPSALRSLLNRYRVQTKAGTEIPPGATARDALGDGIVALWKKGGDAEPAITELIDTYRMQHKGAAKKSTRSAPAKKKAAKAVPPARTPPASRAKAPAPPKPGKGGARVVSSTPVGGGPKRRTKARAECPKCHSKGVVLARSYAGDDYYSCIYCGWQAYKPADGEFDSPLAAQLLGMSAKKD
jgi:hypothetical protein